MASEIKLWQLHEGKLLDVNDSSFASEHLEEDLENLIAKNPALLGDDLLVIDRQRDIPGVGIFDLLCIDADGKVVIVELKRDKTPREAVAQALHYASWLDDADEKEIVDNAREYLSEPVDVAFEKRFNRQLPELDLHNHRIILAAPRLDSPAEQIVNYLNQRHGIDINAVFFSYSRLKDGQKVIARTVLVPDETQGGRRRTPSVAELLKMAEHRQTSDMVKVCRRAASFLREEPAATYGKSFRYWAKGPHGNRMVFGVNVSGEREETPLGNLDVWIPTLGLSEVSGMSETEVRDEINQRHPVHHLTSYDLVVRMQSAEEAQGLINALKGWVSSSQHVGAASP
jgi:hypothetical protein